MQHRLEVDNIKCGGCAHSIVSKLSALDGLSDVAVDVEQGQISFSSENELIDQVKLQLKSMGYPEVGSLEGLGAAGAKAKSFVSCAIGKMTKE
ncbi:MAG: heavy-metal-associated domain-containing protein [Thiomicrospira sp.]|uniref:heavy-metal-associated domain-containing protein n=1 Tax=Thiomicrospira sp. TaxID=935 RepID=UPI001A0D4746|nr:heavy metal-associated domain-containing protein [Thiomicrospira sp.]MBE0493427.1 heavy-metal-associated domain-containing protein [Thiomicrospira sp.]